MRPPLSVVFLYRPPLRSMLTVPRAQLAGIADSQIWGKTSSERYSLV